MTERMTVDDLKLAMNKQAPDPLLSALNREHPGWYEFARMASKPSYPQPKPVKTVHIVHPEARQAPPQRAHKRDVLNVADEWTIPFRDISNAVIKVSGISKIALCSPARPQYLVHWRNVIYFLARKYTMLSMPMIGRMVGGRDHSTIHHGLKKVEHNWLKYRDDVAKVEAILNA